MAQQDWRGKVVQAVDELGFTANPGIYRVAFEIAAPWVGRVQSQCHLVDQCLGRGDVGPVHRHAPGLRRTGVLRVANCAAQCSGDGLPFRNGGVSRGMHGECATGGSGHPYRQVPGRIVRPATGPSRVRARIAGRDRDEPSPACRQSKHRRRECGCHSYCLAASRFWIVARVREHSAGKSPRMRGEPMSLTVGSPARSA